MCRICLVAGREDPAVSRDAKVQPVTSDGRAWRRRCPSRDLERDFRRSSRPSNIEQTCRRSARWQTTFRPRIRHKQRQNSAQTAPEFSPNNASGWWSFENPDSSIIIQESPFGTSQLFGHALCSCFETKMSLISVSFWCWSVARRWILIEFSGWLYGLTTVNR